MILKGKFLSNNFEQEIPSGAVNGSNVTFGLSSLPLSNKSVLVYLNGLLLIQGTHYTISNQTITFAGAPQLGQQVYATYFKR